MIYIPRKKTNEEFINEIFNLVGNEYKVLSEYINTNTKIKMKHNKCGNEYLTTPNNFLSGSRCPKCFGTPKKTQKEFENEVNNILGKNYIVLSKYKGTNTKVKMKHLKCGYEYEVKPSRILEVDRCPKCFGSIKKSQEEFIKEVYELVGNEYEVLSEYINNKTKIKMKHNKCGTVFYPIPGNFINCNTRCPKCKSFHSKGEEAVREWLFKNNFKFEEQVSFSNCKNEKTLKFDFKIFINENDFVLLEYDGIQHFKECFYGNEGNLEKQKIRDETKNKFCKENNLTLYRIKYTELKRINEVLNEYLN